MDTPKPKRARKAAPPKTAEAAARVAQAIGGKLGEVAALLRRPEGATIAQLMAATGWQAHSVRGAMSGALKKKQGLAITSEKTDVGRVYRIVEAA